MPFLDTSVVVAYYVPEPLSSTVQKHFAVLSAPTISELDELEFYSALSLRLRLGDLEPGQAKRVSTLFQRHLDGGLYARAHLQPEHDRAARDLIGRFDLPLKSPDALHLAVASIEQLAARPDSSQFLVQFAQKCVTKRYLARSQPLVEPRRSRLRTGRGAPPICSP